jgi:hypothetical protein
MPITFGNDNDIIVYALEKILSFATINQYIFVAHCVWWLASIIGLEPGLIIYIDNLHKGSEISKVGEAQGISATPQDIQGDLRSHHQAGHIHPDRRSRVQYAINDISDLELGTPVVEPVSRIIADTKHFIQKFRREHQVLKKKADTLSRTRSGKIIAKPSLKDSTTRVHSTTVGIK